MKKTTSLVFCFLICASAVFSQSTRVSFRNDRFSTIKVRPVKLLNANDFYSDFMIDEELGNSLSKVFSLSDLNFIAESAHETALPPALNSLEKRDLNRNKMKDLSLYRLATFTSGDTEIELLVAPVSENKKARAIGMIGDDDMILFFNKSAVFEMPVKETSMEPNIKNGYTCEDYSRAIVAFFESGIKITTPSDSIPLLLPEAEFQGSVFDFKEEYLIQDYRPGLQNVTLVCDKDGDKPLYELIFEFENADSTLKFAELMFGVPNHPQLDHYWVITVVSKEMVFLGWTFNNKLVLACNLPGTEMEDSEDFILSDEFIAAFNGTENTSVETNAVNNDTDDNVATSLAINNLIIAAMNDFDQFKTDLMPNKTAEYNAVSYVNFGQEQAIVRKNAAGNWRLEVRFAPYATSEEAKQVLENTITFYQTLEGLEYRLVKKSDLDTGNGRNYIWDIQTMDDESTGIILKWQSYPASNGMFGLKMELGK
ncbi:MAG: hypothetical protein IPH20_22095 [Bacteroidales bacterium]|nr:hypothetical protein [Bacteroidales bacterium]